MATVEFRLPDLGEGLEDAEVIRWLVAEGQEIVLNQPLVEVDTAKALVEIPSPFAGKVVRLFSAEGDVVKVGAPLVSFEVDDVEGSQAPALLVGYGAGETQPKRRRRLTAAGAGRSSSRDASEVPVVPVGSLPSSIAAAPPVRKLAKELKVDLSTLKGTGPGGRITREDVESAAGSADSSSATSTISADGPVERISVRGVRRLVAQKMHRSATEIPHVTTFLTVDATVLGEVRAQAEQRAGRKVTALAVVGRAFIEVCKKHPKLNASWDGDAGEIVLKRYYHLGIAVDTERGLIVPVVRDADRMGFAEIAAEIERLASAARGGTIKPDEVTGGTVTISNVGSFGAEFGTPIINFPESCILALGVLEDRPAIREGEVVVVPSGVMSLSFDHRILDGAEAGRALLDLKHLLEDPQALGSV